LSLSLTTQGVLYKNTSIKVWSSISNIILYSTMKVVITSVAIEEVTATMAGHDLVIIILTNLLLVITNVYK
jgi:hypothetical protein